MKQKALLLIQNRRNRKNIENMFSEQSMRLLKESLDSYCNHEGLLELRQKADDNIQKYLTALDEYIASQIIIKRSSINYIGELGCVLMNNGYVNNIDELLRAFNSKCTSQYELRLKANTLMRMLWTHFSINKYEYKIKSKTL